MWRAASIGLLRQMHRIGPLSAMHLPRVGGAMVLFQGGGGEGGGSARHHFWTCGRWHIPTALFVFGGLAAREGKARGADDWKKGRAMTKINTTAQTDRLRSRSASVYIHSCQPPPFQSGSRVAFLAL